MIDIKKINLEKDRRIIVVSDIHASLKMFKRLLKKVNYTDEDYLFINGDLCEKGYNSLEVIEFVRRMTLNTKRIFVTKGNSDIVHRYVFEGNEGIYNYMKNRKQSVLNEMLELHRKALDDFQNLDELGDFYYKHFKNEIDWLDSLPIAYETNEYIIVHAGLNGTIEQTDEVAALTIPSFYERGHSEEKFVIVGHWPVGNYRTNVVASNNPLIDYNKRIVAIDGGNRIKRAGQLNALIIEKDNYSYAYIDTLTEQRYIQQDYSPKELITGAICYPNYDMTILREEQYFTLCKNNNTNFKQWVKNEYLAKEKEGKSVALRDVSTTFLSVYAGEKVSIIDDTCQGYRLIKKKSGEMGWIPNYCFQ